MVKRNIKGLWKGLLVCGVSLMLLQACSGDGYGHRHAERRLEVGIPNITPKWSCMSSSGNMVVWRNQVPRPVDVWKGAKWDVDSKVQHLEKTIIEGEDGLIAERDLYRDPHIETKPYIDLWYCFEPYEGKPRGWTAYFISPQFGDLIDSQQVSIFAADSILSMWNLARMKEHLYADQEDDGDYEE